MTSKRQKIINIWNSGHKVDTHIIRYGLRDTQELNHVESSVIQTLTHAGVTLTNVVNAPGANEFGWQTPRDILDKKARPVLPNVALKCVHVFNITNGLKERDNPVEAVRRAWYPGNKVNAPKTGIAVGTVGNPAISRVVCRIDNWYRDTEESNRWAFDPKQLENDVAVQLNEKNWGSIIEAVGNARQWGNPIQVEFDGRDKFRIIGGSSERQWRTLS
jgi:hypothetical protein